MQRYKGIIAYDGSGYSGYQIQINGKTVQEVLEKALKKMHKGIEIKTVSSGRTDAGVHAYGQVFHFDSSLILSSDRWVNAMNGLLPTDVALQSVEKVSQDFHARYDVEGKTYKYFLYTGKIRNPFERNFTSYYPYKLNIDRIREAAPYFVGTHDFTSFCSAKTTKENKIRTISILDIEERENKIIFTFTGNGFLYNMVRIIVGTLLHVGNGKIDPEDIPAIFAAHDRQLAGKTAPAEGLYLWDVYYK
ncbi:tRNA pseudouridine(38-40) synthase TruA [Lederbergia lenta]|uniref:tRNA pseudouridine synthase A n=1 Tax=Lederbergia lenta TaxID=1467 RepID=A0A2X4VU09_LEDLE|nr:tRNA pseudouridine(38-40) synthase TruA [Lederbergia lenta]MEC2326343.1 tRNA pseudouridine(38-40) synthase TruA [Lederbergia lenta]SQI51318.1 tRNA pseudouridine synthase A [Lederbergia lenta]